jgi:hypothetical protein
VKQDNQVKRKTGKTVFVLGAGFSAASGAPPQSELITKILELRAVYHKKPYSKNVNKWVDTFDEFLTKGLVLGDSSKRGFPLEDVYTPIDKALAENASIRHYTPVKLFELRNTINKLVALALRTSIKNRTKLSQFTAAAFAEYLVNQCKPRLKNKHHDVVSVITTNWDIILDNKVFAYINEEPVPKGRDINGVVDYCCYMSSLEEKDRLVKPGLYALGKGAYNVKILKLHGSLNWLQCPKCQRLYVKFYRSWNAGYIFLDKYCRHCEHNYQTQNSEAHKLILNIITPTFLKNLNNIQNKLCWQNAGLELAEASKVVFIGYSLPLADFEFKQLLSRFVRTDAKIEVVLRSRAKGDHGFSMDHAGDRFKNFFSGREVKVTYEGAEKYVRRLRKT